MASVAAKSARRQSTWKARSESSVAARTSAAARVTEAFLDSQDTEELVLRGGVPSAALAVMVEPLARCGDTKDGFYIGNKEAGEVDANAAIGANLWPDEAALPLERGHHPVEEAAVDDLVAENFFDDIF